jgi:hypothetical protein
MPDIKILDVLLSLPLNDREDALHPHVTTENVTDPIMIIRLMEAQELPITFGMVNKYTHLFDPECFKKEHFKEVSEAKFCLIRAILLRDYVGQGLVPDIENRLQGCRQVTYSNGGRMYTKPVAKYHRDYMRLVNELDTKGDIPFNLTSIEFHNLSQELKQELLNQGYSVPLNTNSIAKQYKNLSDLLANATEAKRKIKQVSLLIRNTIGQQNRSVSTMACYSPSAPNEDIQDQASEEDNHNEYTAYMSSYADSSNNLEDDQVGYDYEADQSIASEVFLCHHFLSAAETALRTASGERAPLKCWGCGDIPAYAKDCYHRFGDCPYKTDERVQANFKINIEKWQQDREKRQQGTQLSKYAPRPQSPVRRVNQAAVSFQEEMTDAVQSPKDSKSTSTSALKATPKYSRKEQKTPPQNDTELCDMLGVRQDNPESDAVFQTYFTPVHIRKPIGEPSMLQALTVQPRFANDWSAMWENTIVTPTTAIAPLSITDAHPVARQPSRPFTTSHIQGDNVKHHLRTLTRRFSYPASLLHHPLTRKPKKRKKNQLRLFPHSRTARQELQEQPLPLQAR